VIVYSCKYIYEDIIFNLTCLNYSNLFYSRIINIRLIITHPEGADHGPHQVQQAGPAHRPCEHPHRAHHVRQSARRRQPELAALGQHLVFRGHPAEGSRRQQDRPQALRAGLRHGNGRGPVGRGNPEEAGDSLPAHQVDRQRHPDDRLGRQEPHREGPQGGEVHRQGPEDRHRHHRHEGEARRGSRALHGAAGDRCPGHQQGPAHQGPDLPGKGGRRGQSGVGEDVEVRLGELREEQFQVQLLTDTSVPVGLTVHLSCRPLEPEDENNLVDIDKPPLLVYSEVRVQLFMTFAM
jgi:hypothetical protein